MRKTIIIALLALTACQKDYYLNDLNEAEALIQTLQGEKNSLSNRINVLNTAITNLNQDNNNLLNDLNDITNNYNDAVISAEETDILISELETTIDRLTVGIRNGWYRFRNVGTNNQHWIHLEGGGLFLKIENEQIVNIKFGHDSNHFWDRPGTTDMVLTSHKLKNYNHYQIMMDAHEIGLEYTDIKKVNMYLQLTIETHGPDIDLNKFSVMEGIYVDDINSFKDAYDSSLATTSFLFSDPFYRNIDYNDPKDMLRAFVEDASRHGIDVSYIYDQEFIFEFQTKYNITAQSAGMCRDLIHIIWGGDSDWKSYWWKPSDKDISRLKIFYHEMGHDVFNYWHTCDQNNIMAGSDDDNYISQVGEHNRCHGDWVGIDTIPYKEWDLWTDKFFSGVDQIVNDCSTNKRSKLIIN